ncbi:glycoside hydrolase family 64 protein [Xylariaceae sp. FL0594]|nr:glycoside hydrolase family 64 protein [Xylariaceae sp. FL0594]
MKGLFSLATAALLGLVAQAAAGPTIARPGGIKDIVITKDNTVNQTAPLRTVVDDTHFKIDAAEAADGSGSFIISIVNNFDSNMKMYLSGHDASGAPVFVGPGGYVYPQAGASGQPPVEVSNGDIAFGMGNRGDTTQVTLSQPLISARLWFSYGELRFFAVRDGNGVSSIVEPAAENPADPSADVLWGFVEFNWDGTSIYANISYVDFVGLSLGMGLTLATGEVQQAPGLAPGAVNDVCNGVKQQTQNDGQPWEKLCVVGSDGQPRRVLAPPKYVAANPSEFDDYYTDYVDQVWAKYASQDLVINTQGEAGEVACRVNGDELQCANDNRGYPKPTAVDIFGCDTGPFHIVDGDNGAHKAVVPRLCAAFVRSTLLLDGGDKQPGLPESSYYTTDPTDHYCRIVHNYEVNSQGYAFPYDDVNPSGGNAAGVVAGQNPQTLKVTVGGWS